MVLETKLQASKTKLLVLEMKLHPSGAMELPTLEKKGGHFFLKTRPK